MVMRKVIVRTIVGCAGMAGGDNASVMVGLPGLANVFLHLSYGHLVTEELSKCSAVN